MSNSVPIVLAQRQTVVPTSGKDDLWEDIGYKAGDSVRELQGKLLAGGAVGTYRVIDVQGSVTLFKVVRYDGYRIAARPTRRSAVDPSTSGVDFVAKPDEKQPNPPGPA